MRINWRFYFLAVVLAGLALSISAVGATFTTVDFPGAVATKALGINDKGNIVGRYTDSSGIAHGFLMKNGTFTNIDVPGSTGTSIRGINNSGDIVGIYFDGSGAPYGFLLSKGVFTTLSFPGSVVTYAFGLNNTGDIVGFYSNDGVFFSGFLYSHGSYTDVIPPAGIFNQDVLSIAINDSGTIIGGIDVGSAMGFSQINDQFFTFALQGTYTTSKGINRSGDIVGGYAYVAAQGHGFLLRHGISATLDFPGAVSTSLNAINFSRAIVGWYDLSNGTEHGMLIQLSTQDTQN